MSNIVEFVKQQEQLFCGALTEQTVTWAKESQFAIQYFQKNDYLAKTALANPTSAQNAIINVAAIGITLNPASKLAYLVPRDGMVCLDISYMGLLHIAMESGVISWGQAKLVHANDTYESNGLDKAPTHKYNAFGDRGDIVGVYCTVKTPAGDYLTEEMSLAEIEAVRKTSKAAFSDKGPWVHSKAQQRRQPVSKIDYQKLREIAEKTKIAGEAPVMPFDQRINALNDFMKHFSPDIALALLDERERNQQYIKSRDQENEEIALTVGKLRVELEGKDSKIANLTAERDALREATHGISIWMNRTPRSKRNLNECEPAECGFSFI